MHAIRERIEAEERERLSPHATRASDSMGRSRPEEPDPIRTAFQRDRDRILHSKAFRRLKHKTQVFIAPEGDHYRTRLTHTLEVAQIARTLGRALRLNEDLIEAIALGHDVGHTPFGHVGERALDEALRRRVPERSFRHHEQSLRIVEELEPLNLTAEVRAGIAGHSKGRADLTQRDGERVSTLEAAVVRISDRVAYLNHDLDDAVRAGIIDEVPLRFRELGATQGARIGRMVEEVVQCSLDEMEIRMPDELFRVMNELKNWLFDSVYDEYPRRFPDIRKAERVIAELFDHYAEPGHLPPGFEGIQGAVDYVAGMTDRFAMNAFIQLRVPQGLR